MKYLLYRERLRSLSDFKHLDKCSSKQIDFIFYDHTEISLSLEGVKYEDFLDDFMTFLSMDSWCVFKFEEQIKTIGLLCTHTLKNATQS